MTDTISDEQYNEARDEEEHFQWVSVSDLHDDPENVRSNYTEIEELADSIKSNGLLQPIVVRRDREGKFVIVMGHRRQRALKHAGIFRTRVIVRHKEMIPDEVLAQMLAENTSRVALDPIDEARGMQRLMKLKNLNSHHQVAQVVGKNQSWVSTRLRLLELDGDDQNRVRRGTLGIQAGATKARAQGGHSRPGAIGRPASNHFSIKHDLGSRVQRRCESMGHKRAVDSVGGVGCGKCWEAVIRQDERKQVGDKALETGRCAACNSHVDKVVPEGADISTV